jgi:hypothetical protein
VLHRFISFFALQQSIILFFRHLLIVCLLLFATPWQPLWKPAQPRSEQRRVITWDSFFLFLRWLFGKIIMAELLHGFSRDL